MKPQEIDKVASMIVRSLAASPGAGVLGCGSMSSTAEYTADCTVNSQYSCIEGGYECGVAAQFFCSAFSCGGGMGAYVFACDDAFTCGEHFHCYGGPGGSHLFAPPPY